MLNIFLFCGLTSVTIPNSVTEIASSTFSGCINLTSAIIPNSVTTIRNHAFSMCESLTSITIPNSVTEIGEDAFWKCSSLKNVYSYAESVPLTADGVFSNVQVEYATLFVPLSSIETYKKTFPWEYFGNIVAVPQVFYIVDGQMYKDVTIPIGESIFPEEIPQKEGHSFSGWSEIPTIMPAEDVTVTGSFTINKYKLIYKVDDDVYKTYEVEYADAITPEEAPTKEGYSFNGWDEIPATMPAKDVMVTGSFTINKYTLTYKVDGETYKTYEVEYGADITAEIEPTKKGCTFGGWGDIPATMPANDVIVEGSFNINSYTLTYMVDGEILESYSFKYGEKINIFVGGPWREGYTFSGWSEVPLYMPAENVTITGFFTLVDAIEGVTADDDEYQIYTIDGVPVDTLQKGVNIIKYENGTVKKVVVK